MTSSNRATAGRPPRTLELRLRPYGTLTEPVPADYNRHVQLPYALLCTILGVALGWLPFLLHGPAAFKFDTVRVNGAIAVWAFYTARMLIGFLIGITRWPTQWYLRGPLCGLVMMAPVSLIALATPGCAWG